MVTAKIKTILTASGCTLVLYEQDKLANLKTDRSDQFDIVGLIIQPNDIQLEVKANAIHEHYNPLTIEVLQQVRLEDDADNNEIQLQALLDLCKQIIVRLIALAEFKTITPVTVSKIPESKYDANMIGWSMPLNLYYLLNETRNPCL
jgi:hypothetical protein